MAVRAIDNAEDFSFDALLQEQLMGRPTEDAGKIGRAVYDSLPPELQIAAGRAMAPRHARDVAAHASRHAAQQIRNGREVTPLRPVSAAKPAGGGAAKPGGVSRWAIAARSPLVLRYLRKEIVGFKRLGECGVPDLDRAIEIRVGLARANVAEAKRMERIRAELIARNVETVGELPEEIIVEIIRWKP